MRKLCLGALLLGGLLVGGCQSTKNPYDPQKPIDQMNTQEWCDYSRYLLTNPNNSADTKRIISEKMRARNCPGAGT